MLRTLVIIPTYNERENVPLLSVALLKLKSDFEVLFVDDNSPDGTGKILDDISKENPRIQVLHRGGKEGIGSAHLAGLMWGYERKFDYLITMDADFTHNPEYIPEMISLAPSGDVIVGSRYMSVNSLPGWNMFRRFLTNTGHVLTQFLLGMNYDATGALRLYRTDSIPFHAFELVNSKGYSFFFESLYILHFNNFKIVEFPIELPARTYGSSKMDFREVRRSIDLLFKTYITSSINPDRFRLSTPLTEKEINAELGDPEVRDPQGWEKYWQSQQTGWSFLYDVIAAVYRRFLIRPPLNDLIKETFKPHAKLLHAGCGGGQVDIDIVKYADITPLDISVNALNRYRKTNGNCPVIHGSIFKIPTQNKLFDGVYNLGVMEHFTDVEIQSILNEFRRVLKDDGKLVIFWPPEFGFSVTFFKVLKVFTSYFLQKKNAKFHPEEISRIKSKEQVTEVLTKAGFKVTRYYFGPKDLFTQCMIVAEKIGEGVKIETPSQSIAV